MSEGYVDLALSDEEQKAQESSPLAEAPKYPYGTSFSLQENVLDEIDSEDWKVGDLFHFHVMAKITGINSHESEGSAKKCVNFQMTAIKDESETNEDEEDDDEAPAYRREGYGKNPALEKYGYLRYE